MAEQKKKVYLHAGDYAFDGADTRILTLLGSCISITLWHPQLKIGGMCHFALPKPNTVKSLKPDGRYAEDCIRLFKQSAMRHHTDIGEYEAKVFGGGNILGTGEMSVTAEFLDDIEMHSLGDRNAAIAFELLMAENVAIKVAHVGEFGYRKIMFDIASGDVWVKFKPFNLHY